jgi:hypothetical protein
MRDSVLTMISMTYDEPSETFPSLLRAMRFAGARNEPDLAPVPPRPDERQCGVSRGTLRGACRSRKQNVPFDKVRAGFEAASLRLKTTSLARLKAAKGCAKAQLSTWNR